MKYTRLLSYIFCITLVTATLIENDTSTNQPINNTCALVTHQPHSQRCQFIKDNQCHSDGLINYYKFYYCKFGFLHSWAIIPLTICLLTCFLGVGITASEYLCPNLYTISKFLKLPDTLAGLTLLAFGNSAPDVFGTYHAIKLDSLALAISELIGASLFIMTVVVGTIAIIQPFEVPKELFIRDCMMYFAVFILVVMSLLIGKLVTTICILLVLCYVGYVGIAIYSHSQKKAKIKRMLRDQRSRGQFSNDDSSMVNVDDIDEVYLDGIASLPTIDDLNLEQISDINAGSIGTFGLKMLLNDLSQHSKMKGSIQLSNERTLSVDQGSETEENEIITVDDFDNVFLRMLFPQLSNWRESGIYDKIYVAITLPIQFVLRITTPVRDDSTISEINNDIYNLTYDDFTPTATFNYSQDKKLVLIQSFLGTLFLSRSLLEPSWTSFFMSLFAPSLISASVNYIYPNHFSDPQFISNIKIINYSASFFGFILAICWVSFISDEIINILHIVSTVYNLSEDILGLTIFALGNSIGDFISNYTIATMGKPIMAFSACFGGPLLALCSAGFSGLVLQSNYSMELSGTLAVICLALFGTLSFLVYIVPQNNWTIDKRIGKILVSIWVGTCTLCIIMEIK
ncbi:Slc8b1 Mitochondrial sodium/calcium exchanger protein [Candida maltosa Xu316]